MDWPTIAGFFGSFSIAKLVGGISVAGVLGWIIQKWWERRTDKHNARRGELREKINEAKALISTVEVDSHRYFILPLTDPAEATLGRTILRNVGMLAGRAHDIDCSLQGARAYQCCRVFKQAISLGDFQSARRQPRAPNDPLLDTISEKARSFERAMERAFRTEFDDDTR